MIEWFGASIGSSSSKQSKGDRGERPLIPGGRSFNPTLLRRERRATLPAARRSAVHGGASSHPDHELAVWNPRSFAIFVDRTNSAQNSLRLKIQSFKSYRGRNAHC